MSPRDTVSDLLNLAREALVAREEGDDPEATPEILELHRETIAAGEALLTQSPTREELLEAIKLLNAYGDAKFGDEWWPGHARPHLGDEKGRRLEALLAL